MKFDVRFYLVSILFIIFDLEVAFLFPWAVSFGELGWYRFLVDDGVPRRADGRLYLRMEKGSAGMGLSTAKPLGCGAAQGHHRSEHRQAGWRGRPFFGESTTSWPTRAFSSPLRTT
jgi:hypothetical protein